MNLTDFLLARCFETLDSMSCQYHVSGSRVLCECEKPSEAVEQALRVLDLVRWCESVLGEDNAISRVLADGFATHPDYQLEWHPVA